MAVSFESLLWLLFMCRITGLICCYLKQGILNLLRSKLVFPALSTVALSLQRLNLHKLEYFYPINALTPINLTLGISMAVREHEDQCSSTEDSKKFCPESLEFTHPRQKGDEHEQRGQQQQQ